MARARRRRTRLDVVQSSALLTRWLRQDRPPPVASGSHAQYDRTTTAPADGQIERVRRRGKVADLADRNPDLAIAEPLGHAREAATVSLHVEVDNRHPARRRRRRAGDRDQPPAVGDRGEGSGLTARGRVDRCDYPAATRPVADP